MPPACVLVAAAGVAIGATIGIGLAAAATPGVGLVTGFGAATWAGGFGCAAGRPGLLTAAGLGTGVGTVCAGGGPGLLTAAGLGTGVGTADCATTGLGGATAPGPGAATMTPHPMRE